MVYRISTCFQAGLELQLAAAAQVMQSAARSAPAAIDIEELLPSVALRTARRGASNSAQH
jgi:hypothetical protein